MNGDQIGELPSGGTGGGEVVRPTRRGYLIAAILAVLGLLLGGGGLLRSISQLSDDVDGFDRVDLPGTGTVRFATAGNYTVYYEALTGTGVPPFRVFLEAPDGEPVQFDRYGGTFDYSVGGHSGTAILTFHIDTPGTYDVTAEASAPPGSGKLAFGKGLGAGLARTLVPGLFLFATLVAATVVAIVTAARRQRARRQPPGLISE